MQELKSVGFPFSSDWKTTVISDKDENPIAEEVMEKEDIFKDFNDDNEEEFDDEDDDFGDDFDDFEDEDMEGGEF